METQPDGVEVVGDRAAASVLEQPPLLIVEAVLERLDAIGLGSGPITWNRIGKGQSNVTYEIGRGREKFVLRRGPRPPFPASTHDMLREARIQQLLAGREVPVPRILDVCADPSVLGVPFYLMEHIEGFVITDALPRELAAASQRQAIVAETIDSLVRLHRVTVGASGLAQFGRTAGYLERQLRRFGSLWEKNSRRDLPEVAIIGEWLERNRPSSQASTVVHGDYRIGNLMFGATRPATVVAILDWEMATVGDPLSDLGYLTATYAEDGGPAHPMTLTSVTRQRGFPGRAEIVERYRRQATFDLDALPWYEALALWKAAIFCEGIYTRGLEGERLGDGTFAPSLATGVPQLLHVAAEIAGVRGVLTAARGTTA